MSDKLLNTAEAAQKLGVSPAVLAS